MSLEHRLLAEKELDRTLAILKFRQPSTRRRLTRDIRPSTKARLQNWASNKFKSEQMDVKDLDDRKQVKDFSKDNNTNSK